MLIQQSRHLEALDYFNRALAVNGDAPDTLSNRGVVYQKLNRHNESQADYEKAVALNPAHVVALVNLGTLLHERGFYREAIARYDAAIAIEPDNADAHFNKALAHVFLGDFLTGWAEYEWRWKKANQRAEYSKFKQPRWLGETPLNGKRILIHAEQGLGDTLHFVRYVRDVEALGATVYLEVQKPLKSLLANVVGTAQVFAQGEPLAAFDVHCPLLSLPHAMRTTKDTIPANVPYIFAPQSQVDLWRDKLPPSTAKKRIGLVWAGKASQSHDHNRSMPLAALLPLFELPNCEFISLQHELRDGDAALLAQNPNVLHLGDTLGSFADTAAIVDQLDLVISVDTAVAHLAGAMAKPVWVLLSYAGDWHWVMQGRSDCPWYPTAKLFRQEKPSDWEQGD